MLKLDLEVDLDTRIRNALMLAYAGCEQPEQSMEVFREILQSKEGPSHKTITIFFRVCETHYDGVQEAMKMMQKVKLLEIDVDRAMYTAYIQALAAHREFDRATEAIENMESQTRQGPNHNTCVPKCFVIILKTFACMLANTFSPVLPYSIMQPRMNIGKIGWKNGLN
jgi:hypothetical protein